MKIRLTSRACSEIDAIAQYVGEHSPLGGAKVAAALEEQLRHLKDAPHFGRKTDKPDVRSVAMPRFPYKIFYRLKSETIEVLSIFHTAQNPENTP